MHKFFTKIFLLINFITIVFNLSAQVSSGYNFTNVRQQNVSTHLEYWKLFNKSENYTHPDFGMLAEYAPCEDCVEELHKRTSDQRVFRDIKDTSKIYYQQSYGAMNELIQGRWISIQDKLRQTDKHIYSNKNATSVVNLHTDFQYTNIIEAIGQVQFNNWLLQLVKDGQVYYTEKANWKNIQIGEDGAFIQNIFNGIDAEIIVNRGSVKTNFIIRNNKYGVFDEMLLTDRYASTRNFQFKFADNHNKENYVGALIGMVAGKPMLQIDKAKTYIAGMEATTVGYIPYSITDASMSMVINYTWMQEQLAMGTLVIDPMVTSTATKNKTTIIGSKYSATCFTEYCSYDLRVPVLSGVEITDVTYTFNYRAIAPCQVDKGGFTIHVGGCRAPAMPNFYKCNLPTSGICNAIDISMFEQINTCLSDVYCTNDSVDFQLRFYRCAGPGTTCGSDCIGADSDWIVTFIGNTLEKVPPTLSANVVCQGTTVTGNIAYTYGAPPYTYIWSLNPDGSSPLATGATPTISVTTPGTHSIYVLTKDACNVTFRDTLTLVVHPSYNNIVYDTVCSSELPLVWNGITVSSGGSSAAVYTNTTIHGCDSITTLHLTVIPPKTSVENMTVCAAMLPFTWRGKTVTAGGSTAARDTIMASNGCDSIITLNLSVSSNIIAYSTITICHTALPYTWNGKTITSGGYGAARDTTTSVLSSCDSITILNLIVVNPIVTNLYYSFCYGGSYNYFGTEYTVAGTYTHSYISIHGCDSTVNLHLTRRKMDTVVTNTTICPRDSILFHGTTYNTAGTYFYHQTTGACDTVFRLNLNIQDTIRTFATYEICTGDSIVWNDTAYYSTEILYFRGVNAAGCDTVHRIILDVYEVDTFITYASICPLDSLLFYDTYYSIPGTYDYFDTISVCHAVHRLILSHQDTIFSYDIMNICAGSTYEYDGLIMDTTGTYTFTGVNAAGCDTSYSIYLYVDPPHQIYLYETICNNNDYDFFGTSITTAGTYTHHSSVGCDTTWTLFLDVIDTIRTETYIDICEGDGYFWKGVHYTSSGTYKLTGTNAANCDTSHTIHLTVYPADTITTHQASCFGGVFDFYGITIIGAGTYIVRDTVGVCDTIRKVIVTLHDTIKTSYTDTFCTGMSYTWHGVTYTTSGVYELLGVNSLGCDTLHTLSLYFTPPDTIVTDKTICSGKTEYLGGTAYTTSGTYYYYNSTGTCDIVYQLNLTVTDTIRTVVYDTICAGLYIYYDGEYFTSTGTYNFYGQNINGCDTLRTLHLYVEPPIMDTTIATICPGESYPFYGVNYSEMGVYTRSSITEGCDTAFVLILTVPDIPNLHDTFNICAKDSVVYEGNVLRTTGVYPFHYTSVDGCDSTYTITLNVVPYIIDSITDTVCDNEVYNLFDSLIYDPGVYHRLTIGVECDTMRILTLHHNTTYAHALNLTLCRNELPYNILGVNIPVGSVTTMAYDSVLLTTTQGCDSMVTINVTIHDTSRTDIDTTVCYGTIFNFGTHTISTAGVYTMIYENSNQCDSVVVMDVAYPPAPIYQDTALSGCAEVLYYDSMFYESVIYVDTYRNVINCDSVYRTVNIEVKRVPYDTIRAEICQGETYNFNGKIYSTPIIDTDTFVYDNGCDSFITLVLVVNPLPNIRIEAIPDEDVVCLLDTVTLQATGAESYMFYDAYDRWLHDGDEIRVILPNKENYFYVIGVNEYGCVDTTRIQVLAFQCCDVLMPTAFSPNGDGMNDTYGPVTLGTPEDYRFEIYNRWGELVFISYHVNKRWDGTFPNGKVADAGTYFYKLSGMCEDGTPIEFKGDVTLIR